MERERLKIVSLAPFLPNRTSTHAGGAFYGRYAHLLAQEADVTSIVMTAEQSSAVDISTGVRLLELVTPKATRLERVPYSVLIRETFIGLRLSPVNQQAWLEDPEVLRVLRAADVVEIQWGQLLPLVPGLRRVIGSTPIVVFLHDVMSQSINRLRIADSKAGRTKDAARKTLVLPAIKRSERRLLRQTNAFSVPSQKDVEVLAELDVQLPHVIFQLGPDVPALTSKASEQSTVLITGAMFRRENYEGAIQFLQDGWPRVRAEIPTARLRIVGAQPDPSLLNYHGLAGVEIIGWVDDLDQEYLNARMLVAPLWQGAGVKKKVLDALAFGRPVVGTNVAAEGLTTLSGGHAPILSGENPKQLANHVISLLLDDAACDQVGRDSWSWASTLSSLDETIVDTLDLYRKLISEVYPG